MEAKCTSNNKSQPFMWKNRYIPHTSLKEINVKMPKTCHVVHISPELPSLQFWTMPPPLKKVVSSITKMWNHPPQSYLMTAFRTLKFRYILYLQYLLGPDKMQCELKGVCWCYRCTLLEYVKRKKNKRKRKKTTFVLLKILNVLEINHNFV